MRLIRDINATAKYDGPIAHITARDSTRRVVWRLKINAPFMRGLAPYDRHQLVLGAFTEQIGEPEGPEDFVTRARLADGIIRLLDC